MRLQHFKRRTRCKRRWKAVLEGLDLQQKRRRNARRAILLSSQNHLVSNAVAHGFQPLLNTAAMGRASCAAVPARHPRCIRPCAVPTRAWWMSSCIGTRAEGVLRERCSRASCLRCPISRSRGTRFAPRACMLPMSAIAPLACRVQKRRCDVERHVQHVDAHASFASIAGGCEENSRALSHLRIVFSPRASHCSRVDARADGDAVIHRVFARGVHACRVACCRKPA